MSGSIMDGSDVLTTKTSRGARLIVSGIRRSIESGGLRHGDQLPPERELSRTYLASRGTVRRALDELSRLGFVTRKIGSGTFVSWSGPASIDVDNVVEQISPLQLMDARMGFERQMARLAVVHATRRDIEGMEVALSGLRLCENNKEKFTRLDSEFHLLLARASGNPLIVRLYNQINEVRTHSQWRLAREQVLSPPKIREYNVHHELIVAGLRRRDVNAMIDALNDHMNLAYSDLLSAVNFGED